MIQGGGGGGGMSKRSTVQAVRVVGRRSFIRTEVLRFRTWVFFFFFQAWFV